MPLFGRRKPPPPARSSGSPFTFDPNGPEKIAEVAKDLYGHQRFAEAMVQSERAIDLLHTLYLFENMRQRQPSPADAWIIDGYTSALGATLAMDGSADVAESVRTTTHRLRTILSAAERVGLPVNIYREALTTMGVDAGHVNVDDILWD